MVNTLYDGCFVQNTWWNLHCDCIPYVESTRVWDDPYTGQVRLQKGSYSSEGLVEIYCNDKWGTVCNNGFTQTGADTVCKQLGYTDGTRVTS